jgi:prepilin-type N-terminal cleavage/methylation domain-containing protein
MKKGFTLLEILIVFFIIAILLSFGIPHFRNYKRNVSYNAAVMSTLEILETANSYARSTKRDCFVVFAPNNDVLGVELQNRAVTIVVNNGSRVAPNYRIVEDWILLPNLINFGNRSSFDLEGNDISDQERINIIFPIANETNETARNLFAVRFDQITGNAPVRTEIYFEGLANRFIFIDNRIIEEREVL